MPNTHSNITDLFEDIADAIREQDETTDPIVADTFPARIRAIPSGGGTDGVQECFDIGLELYYYVTIDGVEV